MGLRTGEGFEYGRIASSEDRTCGWTQCEDGEVRNLVKVGKK